MKSLTKAQAEKAGWVFVSDNMAEKFCEYPAPGIRKEFGRDDEELLRVISEFEARAGGEHHANLY